MCIFDKLDPRRAHVPNWHNFSPLNALWSSPSKLTRSHHPSIRCWEHLAPRTRPTFLISFSGIKVGQDDCKDNRHVGKISNSWRRGSDYWKSETFAVEEDTSTFWTRTVSPSYSTPCNPIPKDHCFTVKTRFPCPLIHPPVTDHLSSRPQNISSVSPFLFLCPSSLIHSRPTSRSFLFFLFTFSIC